MDQIRVRLKKGKTPMVFSEAFKKRVVNEYETGLFTKENLSKKYGIRGNSVLLEWCRKYGKFAYDQPLKGRIMKDPKLQKIKELEQKLKEAELKIKVYDKLIEVTNRELDTDIIKKIEARLSGSWQQEKV